MEVERKTERKRKRFAARLKVYKGVLSTETEGPVGYFCLLRKYKFYALFYKKKLWIPM